MIYKSMRCGRFAERNRAASPRRKGSIDQTSALKYVFAAIDRTTKLVPLYKIGKRNADLADNFMRELRMRVSTPVPQLTTDGWHIFRDAVEQAFGCDVHYQVQIKDYYGPASGDQHRYSPPKVKKVRKETVSGSPQNASTAHVERQNLTLRMRQRRFTRLTNAYSKKLRNLKAAVALHYGDYNFCRVHETIGVTPAMEAGVTDRLWTLEEFCEELGV